MRSTLRFRKLTLSLHPGTINREAVELSAELADLLGAALQGVFIEDQSLKELAAASRVGEFRLSSREWRTVDADRLAEELELPYQTLINLYLKDCASSHRRLKLTW